MTNGAGRPKGQVLIDGLIQMAESNTNNLNTYGHMTTINDKLLSVLPLVSKPSRYIGAEVNSVVKDPESVSLRVALCFPDVYEVGVSHLGLKVLYEVLNHREYIYAERAYAPWYDMEDALRARNLPLTTLETGTPLSEMDVVGFTLQYELSYTNILNMLDLGGIPLLSKDRDGGHPLIIAGGPCAFNPEPLAGFIDAFVIGDAEYAVVELADAVVEAKRAGVDRPGLLKALANIEGVYVPAHFEVIKDEAGALVNIINVAGGPDGVTKRTVDDLDAAPFPELPILPYTAAVHARVSVEVSRGCPRGCRFCQAGYIYRPMRERSPRRIFELAEKGIAATGYEELSLSSLSTGDYSCLLPLMKGLMDHFERSRVSVSLPSLRVGTLTPEICREVRRVRKSGFTIAPEAGTQRLRDVINKNITEEALVETAQTVFSEGWDIIKLYFMIGLPTETDEDMEGIIRLARRVLDAGKRAGGRRGKRVNVGVSVFVPKPHTPFQWMGMVPVAEARRKKDALTRAFGRGPLALKSGHVEMSALEGAFARGGRELGPALKRAWELGARFDGWTERFDYALWVKAFEESGLDVEREATREYALDAILPWDHIRTGVSKRYLVKEYERATRSEVTPECREKCSGCGLKCTEDDLHTKDRLLGPVTPVKTEGGNRPTARVRLRYTKLAPVSLLSHSELMTLMFRAVSRAELPIAFSDGFNPHPKISFGPALAVGIESEAEILDMELGYALDLGAVVRKLNGVLPAGVRVAEARVLMRDEPAAGVGFTHFTYEAEAPEGFTGNVADAVAAFLSRDKAVITRVNDKGAKELDIRPMVLELTAVGVRRVRFTLVESGGKSAKPFEIAQALFGVSPHDSRAVRVKRVSMGAAPAA